MPNQTSLAVGENPEGMEKSKMVTTGINAVARILGEEEIVFPKTTMIGAMAQYISTGNLSGNFVPMNANFGIVEPLGYKVRGGKVAKYEVIATRALESLKPFYERVGATNYLLREKEEANENNC